MRLYEIEAGQKEPIEPDSHVEKQLSTVVSLIEKNCKLALHSMMQASSFIYRGIKKTENIPPVVFMGQPRIDRKPKSSTEAFHDNVNLAFRMAKFKANRSNSIFVTSVIGDAAMYSISNLYMIFPIDGFAFTWSPKINDLYVNEYRLFGNSEEAHYKRMDFFYNKPSPELIQEFLEKSHYTNKDFGAAIKSGNEIMINGKYYAVHTKYKDWPEIRGLI